MSNEFQDRDLPAIDASKASDVSIVKTHARIRRETSNASPVGFFSWVAVLTVFVFAWVYGVRYMGAGESQIYLHERTDIALYKDWLDRPVGPIEYDYFAIGEELYVKMACVGCHQADGNGLPGQFPPLAGSEYVVTEDPTLPTKILLYGLVGPVTVKGQEYNGNMAAYGPGLKDHEIAGLVTYIRNNWGNEGSEVTLEDVAAVRAEVGERGPLTAADL